MTTNRLTICRCGTDLRKTLASNHSTTTVLERGKRYVLLHCPSCGTLYVAIDELPYAEHVAGVGV